MNAKVTMLILLIVAFVGLSIADDDDKRLFLIRGRRPRPLQQLLRPLAGRPLIGGGLGGLGGLGGASAAGAGNGAVIGNQAVGTGTGIANAGPGGFGIGVGIGVGVATPLGNFAFGDGQSISIGK
ncbi:glycine-rich protein 23-like [Daphnia magna]|uniref:Uncharacterized protein n=2 Tax=Daphnia magna TaxID=35525 RepID=A0A0P5LDK1_9CRUS|nr:glycine-rich protein 23-like [Daphnia magna]KAK4035730.1 hypothetical protein OUZ56_027814 [Daphnia magna]KZS19245.1 Uncharacterized protein APZ42_014381 [Daphnia magna]